MLVYFSDASLPLYIQMMFIINTINNTWSDPWICESISFRSCFGIRFDFKISSILIFISFTKVSKLHSEYAMFLCDIISISLSKISKFVSQKSYCGWLELFFHFLALRLQQNKILVGGGILHFQKLLPF